MGAGNVSIVGYVKPPQGLFDSKTDKLSERPVVVLGYLTPVASFTEKNQDFLSAFANDGKNQIGIRFCNGVTTVYAATTTLKDIDMSLDYYFDIPSDLVSSEPVGGCDCISRQKIPGKILGKIIYIDHN